MPRDTTSMALSDEERSYIERRMKAEGFTSMGDYLRYTALVEGVFAGDTEAWRILRQRAQRRAIGRLSALVESLRDREASAS